MRRRGASDAVAGVLLGNVTVAAALAWTVQLRGAYCIVCTAPSRRNRADAKILRPGRAPASAVA